jgi:CoA-transferase family III
VVPGWSIATTMAQLAEKYALLGGPVLDGPALLGERAAFAGVHARGSIAPGGACRFVAARDGWLAVNLARPSDPTLANAWLDDIGLNEDDPWPGVLDAVASRSAESLVERAAELGLAVSRLGETHAPAPIIDVVPGPARASSPLVVDLSSLWSGPLCAQLLGLAGARVVKVESVERPDASRHGAPMLFDLLHHGHRSVALSFGSARGRDALRALIAAADIVIEASRPRALEQLGLDAGAYVARGAVWISITAYGREAAPQRIGFGDDVGVAAGIHAGNRDAPLFCGDAIADPISGLYAAVGGLAALARGRGALIDVAMASTARLARGEARRPERTAERRAGRWFVDDVAVERPRARRVNGSAAAFGSDTEGVMAEIGVKRWD